MTGRRPRRRGHHRRGRTSCRPSARSGFTVAALDLGIKAMTPQLMAERGIEVHVLPATATLEDVAGASSPTGVFFSNGPGDPATADRAGRAAARGARRADPVLRHLLRQPAPRPGARLRHLQAEVRPPRHQPAGAWTARPARSRSPRTTTASPSTPRSTGHATDDALRPRRGQPRLPQRRRRRGARLPRPAGLLGAVPPGGGGRPARRRLPVRPLPRPDDAPTDRPTDARSDA